MQCTCMEWQASQAQVVQPAVYPRVKQPVAADRMTLGIRMYNGCAGAVDSPENVSALFNMTQAAQAHHTQTSSMSKPRNTLSFPRTFATSFFVLRKQGHGVTLWNQHTPLLQMMGQCSLSHACVLLGPIGCDSVAVHLKQASVWQGQPCMGKTS